MAGPASGAQYYVVVPNADAGGQGAYYYAAAPQAGSITLQQYGYQQQASALMACVVLVYLPVFAHRPAGGCRTILSSCL